MTEKSLTPLIAEFKVMGQANDAIAEVGADGVPEILAGARRREVCRILGQPLRVRVHRMLSPAEAISIAHREDRGSLEVSWWDRSSAWQRMITDGIVASEARLAEAVAEDKSTISRALALQKAPRAVLDLFPDRRAISQTQWSRLAPLLEDPNSRTRVLARAALLAGQKLSGPAITNELVAAAAGKEKISAFEVHNRHGKLIATITPDHRGAFTIRVKSLTEAHPSYRIAFAKLIHDRFVDVQKAWFGKDDD